jgi:hypothetical protein
MHKLLRGLGVALIALPEPFTTPLGVSLLAASWLLARKQEAVRRVYLRHLLKEYVQSYRRLRPGDRYDPDSLPFTYREALYKRVDDLPRVGARGYAWPDHPTKVPRVIHHVLDVGTVRRRTDAGGTRRGYEGYWGARSYREIRPNSRALKPLFVSAN